MLGSESTQTQQDPKSCLKKVHWKTFVLIIWPLILIPPLLIHDDKATRCAYVMAIMAMFWVTECLPLPVTSLLPIVMFPVFGIMQASEVIKCYIDETIMVFLSSLVLALALEHSNLHKRLALRTLMSFGCSHARLLAGFIFCTTFLSMWISNTAAAAMMVPIIFAVLEELEKEGISKAFDVPPESTNPERDRVPTKLTTAYLLGTAWSASFGGSASLVGSPTNLAFKGIFEEDFPGAPTITFVDWLKIGTPQALLNALITWLYLLIFYMGLFRSRSNDFKNATFSQKGQAIATKIVEKRYKELGSLSFHEAAVAVLFLICVFLWIFRQPGFVTGWGEYFEDKYGEETSSNEVWVSDACASVLIAILMFVIPKEPAFFYADNRAKSSSEGLITWKIIEQQLPWGIMFLIGGGFALAAGSNKSCLSKRISDSMTFLDGLHPYAILVAACITIGILTDFTSNVGTSNIVLPVIADVCKKIKNRHPWYLMFPAVLMCSYAFRTPSGTPPNGIVTMSSNLPPKRLLIGGCGPAIYSLAVVTLFVPFWITRLHGESWEEEWLVARSGQSELC